MLFRFLEEKTAKFIDIAKPSGVALQKANHVAKLEKQEK